MKHSNRPTMIDNVVIPMLPIGSCTPVQKPVFTTLGVFLKNFTQTVIVVILCNVHIASMYEIHRGRQNPATLNLEPLQDATLSKRKTLEFGNSTHRQRRHDCYEPHNRRAREDDPHHVLLIRCNARIVPSRRKVPVFERI